MIKMLRLGHASFETPDIEKAIEHHTQIVGLSLVAREANRAFLATRTGQLAIELTKASRPACTKLSFEVPAHADFAGISRELQSHGVASEERSNSQVARYGPPGRNRRRPPCRERRDWLGAP